MQKDFVSALFLVSLFVPVSGVAQSTIVLDGSGTGRVFEGIGGVSAGASSRLLIDYPEPYRSQILDYLFKPNYGAGLQHLKVELGGDVNSTDGSEPSHMHSRNDENYTRGYEWWLIREAKLRNPNITIEALEWGAPGWIGNGRFFTQDNIDYILKFIQGAKSTYGITIDYVGIWNETDFDAAWIINLKAALVNAGLSTKIVAADQQAGDTRIMDQMVAYPALMSAVDVVGVHYPRGNGPYPQPLQGKRIWASEEGPWRGDWTGARYLAKVYNGDYIGTRATLTEIWSPVTSYYDIFFLPGSGLMYANTPWSGYYDVQPAIWATAHTTQFAQPGWQYLDAACRRWANGSYVTLKHGSDYSIIAETVDSGVSQTLSFSITGGLSTGPLHVWKSDSTAQFIRQADIVPVNGFFIVTLAPNSIYSITTTDGQMKGSVAPPPATAFPFPYADSFESYPLQQGAKYFSAVNGSFDIENCGGGRSGQCLRQAVHTAPIPWHLIGPIEPTSVLGTMGLQNYVVSADVLVEPGGGAKLVGHFNSVDVNSGIVRAIQLYLGANGAWSVRRGLDYLASGSVTASPNTWHSLRLVLQSGRVEASIDGLVVANVNEGIYFSGLAGVGTQGWTNAQFDNFRIDPLPGTGTLVPQSQMTAVATSQNSGNEAAKGIDGYPSTFWVSAYSCSGGCAPLQPLPQSITLSLGGTYPVNKLRYRPRQDDNLSGAITTYNVYTSADGTNFTKVSTGNWPADATEKSAPFTPTIASYVRLEAVAAIGGGAAASEINIEYAQLTANPQPVLTSLNPASATVGSPTISIQLAGANFVAGAVVRWNGSDRPTNFLNASLLTASIPYSDLAAVGSATVTAVNPSPSGGESNGTSFAVTSAAGDPPTGGATSTPYVSGFNTAGRSLRNDYGGWVGMKFSVGATPMNVPGLGRICAIGNAGTHTVKLVSATSGQDVPGGTAQVVMTGCTPGQFNYGLLVGTLTLSPGTSYYLVSQETVGGDKWYDLGPVTVTADAVANSAVYSSGTNWILSGSGSSSYGPVNMVYGLNTAPPVSITVQTSIAGASILVDGVVRTSPATLSWPSGTSHTIAVAATQSGAVGIRYAWNGWSDGGTISHSVAPTAPATYTATLGTQYLLSTSVVPSGSGTIAAVPGSAAGYYDSGTFVQLGATPSNGATFLNWTGDVTGDAAEQQVTMSQPRTAVAHMQPSGGFSLDIDPSAGPLPSFVTGFSTAGRTLRNDYSGWVGMRFTVGSTPLSVRNLGRLCVAGNQGIHTIKLLDAVTKQDIPGGSVEVNLAACTPSQFVYGTLPTTLSLATSGSYFLVSQETAGADRWYNWGPITAASDAVVNSSIYSLAGNWYSGGSTSTSYGPLNFQYSLKTGPAIAATVQTNIPGTSVIVDGVSYAAPKSFTWTAGSPHTIAVPSTQSGGPGIQYVLSSWSDGGVLSHSVAPTSNVTYTATLNTQVIPDTQPPAGGLTKAFVTGFANSTGRPARSDFNGWVGAVFAVGSKAVTLASVGRMCVAGNAGRHIVKLVNAVTRQDLPAGSAEVNMLGCVPGQFVYASLPGLLVLPPSTTYYLASQEASGGDKWNDLGPVSTTADASLRSAVYFWNGSWSPISGLNVSYGPLSFQYSTAP